MNVLTEVLWPSGRSCYFRVYWSPWDQLGLSPLSEMTSLIDLALWLIWQDWLAYSKSNQASCHSAFTTKPMLSDQTLFSLATLQLANRIEEAIQQNVMFALSLYTCK